ncbi:MAG: Ig-like domain-containing protein [Bacteroidota bacterium]
MLKNNLRYIPLLFLLILISCAKRGSITGGTKDTLAPILRTSYPKNFSTNFKGDIITLNFDEYIKLKDVNKQLIISPPMEKAPTISPTTASRTITIKLNEPLLPNTTYSFNFGKSIEDNNENNPYQQFKYVFSTGPFIDSLKLGGTIKDALSKTTDNYVSVMLYEADSKLKDSVIYKNVPRYVTNTLEGNAFLLENLKAGKYLLVAMKDVNSNNKFNPSEDKIGFHKEYVTIPTDTLYEIELFKETPAFKTLKPSQASGNRLTIGYEGKPKDLKIVLKKGNDILPTIVTKLPEKDSVQVWFTPIKADSLRLAVTNENYKNDFVFKLKNQKKDTLKFTPKQKGDLPLREKFTLIASRPLIKFDNSKIKITNKDAVVVGFKTEYDEFTQELKFDFEKEPLQKYEFTILPGAMTDYLEETNDSLSYKLNTKNTSDYGNLRVVLQNVRQFPVIVELTNEKGEVILSGYSEKETTVDFNYIIPSLYTLRVIYDENKNKEWDSGSYLEKRQTEEVIYFPKQIDVRANWDVEQVFDLGFKTSASTSSAPEKK